MGNGRRADLALASGPLFVFLNASNTIIGLTQSLMFLTLIGVFLSPFISVKLRIKKWYLMFSHVPYLGAWGAIGIALILSTKLGLSNSWLLGFVVAMSAANWFFAGFVTLAHNEYVAACMPMSHRGRLAGYSYTAGGAAGTISAAIGGIILLRVAKPMSFGYLYLMMWLICQSGYILALFGRERPTPIEKAPKPWSRAMLRAAWQDKPYLKMLALYAVYNMTFVPLLTVFLPIYGFRDLSNDTDSRTYSRAVHMHSNRSYYRPIPTKADSLQVVTRSVSGNSARTADPQSIRRIYKLRHHLDILGWTAGVVQRTHIRYAQTGEPLWSFYAANHSRIRCGLGGSYTDRAYV